MPLLVNKPLYVGFSDIITEIVASFFLVDSAFFYPLSYKKDPVIFVKTAASTGLIAVESLSE